MEDSSSETILTPLVYGDSISRRKFLVLGSAVVAASMVPPLAAETL